jgi:hypothetical protein
MSLGQRETLANLTSTAGVTTLVPLETGIRRGIAKMEIPRPSAIRLGLVADARFRRDREDRVPIIRRKICEMS